MLSKSFETHKNYQSFEHGAVWRARMPLTRGTALLRAVSRFLREHPYIRGPDKRERLRVKRVALTGPERSAWATAYASGDEGVLFQVRGRPARLSVPLNYCCRT